MFKFRSNFHVKMHKKNNKDKKLVAPRPSRSGKGAKHSPYLRRAFLVSCLILAAGPMYLIYVILSCFILLKPAVSRQPGPTRL